MHTGLVPQSSWHRVGLVWLAGVAASPCGSFRSLWLFKVMRQALAIVPNSACVSSFPCLHVELLWIV